VSAGAKLTGDWRALMRALDPARVKAAIHKEVAKANARIGLKGRALVVKSIRARDYAPNSPITIAIKGSSAPLVDKGDLIQSITYSVPEWYRLRIGVLKQTPAQLNIARILHEGAVIDVRKHPKVRAAVMAQVAKKLGEKRRGASKKVTTEAAAQLATSRSRPAGHLWIIPGRPFLRRPLTSPAMKRIAREEWRIAVRKALGGAGAGSNWRGTKG
jgi:hypothetical protein